MKRIFAVAITPKSWIWVIAMLLALPSAMAETSNFEFSGKLYTKWLYRNNDSQGVLSYGNPFWPDNLSGDNGVGTEFELGIKGRVGAHVQAGVRLKSRFGALWQDWWENGDIAYAGQENSSGESLGMNRAQYLKLRGYWIRAELPFSWVDVMRVGSSDLSMFNEWTIGKIRYIDRDNGKGVFFQGKVVGDTVGYHLGLIALPKLWVGPGWSTGVGDPNVRYPFYSQDWAYGLKLESELWDAALLTVVGSITRDAEIDVTDPDAVGSLYPTCEDELGNPVPDCQSDAAVDTFNRYSNAVVTAELQVDSWDGGAVNLMGGYSYSRLDKQLAANGVALNEGMFPLVYDDVEGAFVRARSELFDVGVDGLNIKLEYFNIGEHFMTIFGARREGDVLWTDGFIEGGQLPTLNLANEFMDFDEPWVESIVGWHGGTLLLQYSGDSVELELEGTVISYNTNGQFRDVDAVYPTFLHSDGYTDTDLYDYANVLDRGRDPRNVYRRHQERLTSIAMLKIEWDSGTAWGLKVGLKGKLIRDRDERNIELEDDNYLGMIWQGRSWLQIDPLDGLRMRAGVQVDHWDEENRRGTEQQGYGDDLTQKVKPFLDLKYSFEGLNFHYYLEYIYKDAQRERDADRLFHVIRSKATMEVAW